jgi:hypothetical protein
MFRALIPVGFMLEPVDGRAEIVLCGSDAPHALHDHGGDDHGAHHHSHADSTCPYAQSSGPAPLPASAVFGATLIAHVFLLPSQVQQTHAHFGPARQQAPRGPPHLA